jgi:hypothetical protein
MHSASLNGHLPSSYLKRKIKLSACYLKLFVYRISNTENIERNPVSIDSVVCVINA